MRVPIVLLCLVVGVVTSLTSCKRPADHAVGPIVSAPRATGPVQRLSQDESAPYIRSRPRGSQIGALVSPQSQVIDGRAKLERDVAEMTARPDLPEWVGQSNWYAFGLAVQPTAYGQIWWNDGAIDGTFSKWFRTDNGLVMVAFFNSRSNPPGR